MTAPTPGLFSFEAGQVVDAQDLNPLPQNAANLYNFLHGGFRIRRPMAACRVTKENREITTATATKILMDLVDLDTDNIYSGISQEKLTIATPGIYRVHLQVMLIQQTLAAASALVVLIGKNDDDAANYATSAIASASGPLYSGMGGAASCTVVAPLNKGDSLYWWAIHNGGVTATVDPAFGGTRASAVWLSPLP